ncbi:hypothetical protein [Methanoplanus limicola]|uniref:Uncharacterized protein n=1 Tax=Methanoplanus limicola DSM 2279 TaxID=937775 RepID=H1YY60_9EURY|nr:hypothetical protein [Methanoplanus limicola]EHQ34155.1 hypothetical protein Metlim_0002 [Methanoplanus limicola DSM 2279]
MILEEKISFYDEEDASIFIDHLKKNGCKAQKQIISEGETEESLTGKVNDIVSWLEEPETSGYFLINKDWKDAKKRMKNIEININKIIEKHNTGDVLFKKEDIEESKEFFFETFREKYESILKQISENSEEPTAAEDIAITADSEGNFPSRTDEAEGSNEEQREAESTEDEISPDSEQADDPLEDIDIPMFAYYNMLIEQEFVEESEEGYIAVKEIDGGDVQVNLPMDNVNLPEDFHYREIIRQTHYELTKKYLIKIDPSVHLYCDQEELIDAICELDFDEDDALQLFHNISIKKPVIYRLLEIISDNNGISAGELTKTVNEITIVSRKENSGYDFTLDESTVLMIISELRKTGILSGNDKKIKLADKNKRRQR